MRGEPEQPPDRQADAACPAGRAARRRSRPARRTRRRGSRASISSSANGSSPSAAPCCLEVRERRRGRLAVALDRRRPRRTRRCRSCRSSTWTTSAVVARLARDHERLGELERHDPGGQLHAAYTRTSASRARSSGDRALASGARGRRFESCRAHALPSHASSAAGADAKARRPLKGRFAPGLSHERFQRLEEPLDVCGLVVRRRSRRGAGSSPPTR